jgi:tRNA pseudouridine32 synthase/23S rRNA pseudouridine746 synthase
VTLPGVARPYPSLPDFLATRFPRIDPHIWMERLLAGKVHDAASGEALSPETPYRPGLRLRYYREVAEEPRIPFDEEILFQDAHMLIACKPHFLPVTPVGKAVNECLLHRLKRRTGIDDLVPVHRLDRDTAGLVLFSVRPETRARYFALFQQGRVHKAYEAIGCPPALAGKRWHLESRIEQAEPWFTYREVAGAVNAISDIELADCRDGRALYHLQPVTGKTHQLRLHLARIGAHIENDPLYPRIHPRRDTPDYARPMQLLARELGFLDPVSGRSCRWRSPRSLRW